MANIKSQKKRNLTNEKRRQRNVAVKSEVKTRVKLARESIVAGNPADDSVRAAQKKLAIAGSKGVLHKRTAARKQSRLMRAAAKNA